MIKRNCQICSKEFIISKHSSKVKNCEKHKGIFLKNHKYENNKLLRKCSMCKTYKNMSEFYEKQKAKKNSFCNVCFSYSTYKYQKEKALQRKLEIIKNKGGKCSRCGYKKNTSALAFHHLDPNQKDFNLDARTLANNSMKLILEELQKCILLCHNCHQEEHNPHLNDLL